MAVLKLSQIAASGAGFTASDFVVAVQGGTTDVLFTKLQIFSSTPANPITISTTVAVEQFTFGSRSAAIGFPVPFVQPTTTATAIALDIMPKGAAANVNTGSGLGTAWIDICDGDVVANDPNYECVRISKLLNSFGHVSCAQGGTGTVRDLIIQLYGGNIGLGTTALNYAGWGAGTTVVTSAGNASAGGAGASHELVSTHADADALLLGVVEFISSTQAAGAKEIAGMYGYTSGATATHRGGEMRFATQINNGALTFRWKITNTGSLESYNGTESLVCAGALATNATDGFLYIPTCAGTPTGTPTTKTGRVPLIYDTTNNKLYIFAGGVWKGGTAPGTWS